MSFDFGAGWGQPQNPWANQPQPNALDFGFMSGAKSPLMPGYGGTNTGMQAVPFASEMPDARPGAPMDPSYGAAPSLWDQFSAAPWLNKNDKNGITEQGTFAPLLGAAQGLFNGYLGMKAYGIAKDQLAEGKRQFGLNYDAQRTTTNSQLEDRQRARVSSAPAGAYQSVGDYMAANSIKGP